MPKFVKNVVIESVDRIHRPGIGHVYKGKITIGDLAEALISGDIKYAPKYQRGKKNSDGSDFDSKTLLQITDPDLEIQEARAAAMAAKYLVGDDEEVDREFYNPDIIWNARKEEGRPQLQWDKKSRDLTIHSTITIPDSAHRHYSCYLLYLWHQDPDSIPDEVVIAEDGDAIDGGQLREAIKGFDPFDEENSSVFTTIFNVPSTREGRLFDEYNVEGKKPSGVAAIDMYSDKTASRRFVDGLMKECPIFDRYEIEMRANTIAAASRKITTVATLDVAIKPFQKRLLELEKNKPVYADLIAFFSNFYSEWATHYSEFQPTASGKARQALRNSSFAMSNIMFFPMFRLAFELWEKYTKAGTDWRNDPQSKEWRDALARLAGTVKADIDGTTVDVPVMARDVYDSDGSLLQYGNPAWRGLILIQQFDQQGQPRGWSLSSTRQTRDAAYHYLAKIAQVDTGKSKK